MNGSGKESVIIQIFVGVRGRVTLPKTALSHLGVPQSGQIELTLLPNRAVLLRAAQPSGSIEDFIGLLGGKAKKVATIDEINEAAAEGWAGQVKPRS